MWIKSWKRAAFRLGGHDPAWKWLYLSKERLVEEIELFTIRTEVNGKKELRVVEQVEVGGGIFPN